MIERGHLDRLDRVDATLEDALDAVGHVVPATNEDRSAVQRCKRTIQNALLELREARRLIERHGQETPT